MVAAIVRHRKADADQARRIGTTDDPLLGASWGRCRDLVDPGLARAPEDSTPAEAESAWQTSPLRTCDVDLDGALTELAQAGDLLAVVTDEKCRVLWTAGPESLQRVGSRVGLVPGALWSELAVGTNALSLACETGRPVEVFASEHWCRVLSGLHGWAAPIVTDGGCLGVVGLYGRWELAHPTARSALALLARLASEHLVGERWVADGSGIELSVLGPARVVVAGEPLALTPRQVEYLAILALEDVGTLEQFRERIYGDRPVSASTVKAELSHLRHRLHGAIGSRPYRLTVPIKVDAVDVRRRLMLGDLDGALGLYRGPLLAQSEAPFAQDYRHVIDVLLRSTLLDRGTVDQLLGFAKLHRFDEALYERVLAITDADDPRRAEAGALLANARRG